jgi:hypothetical protein
MSQYIPSGTTEQGSELHTSNDQDIGTVSAHDSRRAEGIGSSMIYDLMSVLVHTGSAFAGHYYCYCRVQDDVSVASASSGTSHIGKWLLFNDSTVLELNEEQIAAALGVRSDGASAPMKGGPQEDGKTPTTSHMSSSATAENVSISKGVGNSNSEVKIAPGSTGAYMLIYQRREQCEAAHAEDCTDRRTPERVWRIPDDLRRWVDDDNQQYLQAKAAWIAEKAFLNIRVMWKPTARFMSETFKSSVLSQTEPLGDDTNQPSSLSTMRSCSIRIHESSTIQQLIDQALFEFAKVGMIELEDQSQYMISLKVFDAVRGVAVGLLDEYNMGEQRLVNLNHSFRYIFVDSNRHALHTIYTGSTATLKSIDESTLRKPLLLEVFDPLDPVANEETMEIQAIFVAFVSTTDEHLVGFGSSSASSVRMTKPQLFQAPRSYTVQDLLLTVAQKLTQDGSSDPIHTSTTTDTSFEVGPSNSPIDISDISACTICTATGTVTAFPESEAMLMETASAFLQQGECLYIDIQRRTPGTGGAVNRNRLASYFDDLHNTVNVTYNLIRRHVVSQEEIPTPGAVEDDEFYFPADAVAATLSSGVVAIDRRKPIAALKASLAELLGLSVTVFSLRRGGNYHLSNAASSNSSVGELMGSITQRFGSEIKDINQSLQSAGIEDGSRVLVSPLAPLLCPQFRLRLFGVTTTLAACPSVIGTSPSIAADSKDEPLQQQEKVENSNTVPIRDMKLTLHPYYLGTLAVSTDDTPGGITERIRHLFAARLQGEYPGYALSESVEEEEKQKGQPVAMRLRLCEMTSEGEFKLTSTLRDANTMEQLFNVPVTASKALTGTGNETDQPSKLVSSQTSSSVNKYNFKKPNLTDDTCLAVQMSHHMECTDNHILVNLRYWNIAAKALLPPVECALLKSTKIGELVASLPQLFSSLSSEVARLLPAGSGYENFEIPAADDVQIVKPFSWQLIELSSLHSLKWSSFQQHFDARIDAAPWRLTDGAVLVIRSRLQAQAAGFVDEDAASLASAMQAHHLAHGGREVGFKLFTAEEQRERGEREAKEAAERKANVEEKMKLMLQLKQKSTE